MGDWQEMAQSWAIYGTSCKKNAEAIDVHDQVEKEHKDERKWLHERAEILTNIAEEGRC